MRNNLVVSILLVGVRFCYAENTANETQVLRTGELSNNVQVLNGLPFQTNPDTIEYSINNGSPENDNVQNVRRILSSILENPDLGNGYEIKNNRNILDQLKASQRPVMNNLSPEHGTKAKITIQFEFPFQESNCKQVEGLLHFLNLVYNQFSKYCETTGKCRHDMLNQYPSNPNTNSLRPDSAGNNLNSQFQPLPQDNQKYQRGEHQEKLNGMNGLLNQIRLLLRKSQSNPINQNLNLSLNNKDSRTEALYSTIEHYIMEYISKSPYILNSGGLQTLNLNDEARNIISLTSMLYDVDSKRFEKLFKIVLTTYNINYNIVNEKIVPVFNESHEGNNIYVRFSSKVASDNQNNLNKTSFDDLMNMFQKLQEAHITNNPISENSAFMETKSILDVQNPFAENNTVINTQFDRELLKLQNTQTAPNPNVNTFFDSTSSNPLNSFSSGSYQKQPQSQKQDQLGSPLQPQYSQQNFGLVKFENRPVVSPKQSQSSQLNQGSFIFNNPVHFLNKPSVTPNQSQSNQLKQESFSIRYPVNFQNQPSLSPDQSQSSDLNQGSMTDQHQRVLPLTQSLNTDENQHLLQGNRELQGNSQNTTSPTLLTNKLLNQEQMSPFYPVNQNNQLPYSQPSQYIPGRPNGQYLNENVPRPGYYYQTGPNAPTYLKPGNPLYNYFYVFGHHQYPISGNVDHFAYSYPKIPINPLLVSGNYNLASSAGSAASAQSYALRDSSKQNLEENPLKNYLSVLKQKLQDSSIQLGTKDNGGKLVEVTYALYQPQVVQNKPIYVKYRIPYERLATNNITYLTQQLPANLIGENKDLLELIKKNATIISAKVIEPNDKQIEEQLKIIKDVNSGLSTDLNIGNDRVIVSPLDFFDPLNETATDSTTVNPSLLRSSSDTVKQTDNVQTENSWYKELSISKRTVKPIPMFHPLPRFRV